MDTENTPTETTAPAETPAETTPAEAETTPAEAPAETLVEKIEHAAEGILQEGGHLFHPPTEATPPTDSNA